MNTEPANILVDDLFVKAITHMIANTQVNRDETLADVLADVYQNDIDCPQNDLDGRNERGLSPWAIANANYTVKLIASRVLATIIVSQERERLHAQ